MCGHHSSTLARVFYFGQHVHIGHRCCRTSPSPGNNSCASETPLETSPKRTKTPLALIRQTICTVNTTSIVFESYYKQFAMKMGFLWCVCVCKCECLFYQQALTTKKERENERVSTSMLSIGLDCVLATSCWLPGWLARIIAKLWAIRRQ